MANGPPPSLARKALGLTICAVAIAIAYGIAKPYGLETLVFASFSIQFVVFIPSYFFNSEKVYDLTGSMTYLILCLYSLSTRTAEFTLASTELSIFLLAWCLRLGTFLFTRILDEGQDKRFIKIKQSAVRFLTAWMLQGLWVFLTALPVWFVQLVRPPPLSSGLLEVVLLFVGTTLWCFGFLFEVVADQQKRSFKANPANKGRFITTGLWSISRHPNYFGEINIWVGVYLIACSQFQTIQFALLFLLSPIFVTFLLTKVSGIPMLEKSADERWGNNADYQRYKQTVPVLFPRVSTP
mmetsp:Transcript_10321/g.25952  ORF Transcript_10321/g.25952 Transcript_10321/m.25952 type:complete len:296 (-) Transcript_10321:104-991(-)